MEKIRILVVLDTLGCGGAETYFLTLFDKIDKNRFTFYLAYSEEGNLSEEFKRRDISFIKIPQMDFKSLISNIQTSRRLYNFIKINKIDILHANLFISSFWSSIAAKRAGIPYIKTIWASLVDESFIVRFFSRRILEKFYSRPNEVFLCLFDSSREELVSKYFIEQHKIRLVNLGIDIDKFKPGERNLKLLKELGIKDGSPVIGTVSNLHKVKKPELFLQIIPLVKEKIKNAKFVMVGDGPLKGNLFKMARQLDITQEVVFTGYRRDVNELLRVFDVSVMPAMHQLGGLSILESLATGVPVVSSRCNGQKDLIKDGFNGGSFTAGDPHSLAEVIIDVLSHKDRLEQMKLNSRIFVENKFDFNNHVSQMAELYTDLAIGK